MRTSLIAIAPLALVTSPVLAQTADVTGTVLIDGSVAGRCLFTTPNATISLGELALGGADSSAGKLDTSKVNGQSATLAGWCNNAAATMSVEAFPLTNPASGATGFDKLINYTATAVAGDADPDDSSITDGAGTPQTVGLYSGDIEVTLSNASTPAGGLLVAGGYTGSVIVTLAPNYTPPE